MKFIIILISFGQILQIYSLLTLNQEKMLSAESPVKYQSQKNLQQYQQLSKPQGLPKILTKFQYDNNIQNQQYNHRTSPLRKSHSMSLILHGGAKTPGSYYIDELERFSRNHDMKNKQQREKQRQILMQKLNQRRTLIIQRQNNHRKQQQENVRSVIQRNTLILQAHKKGLIRNNTFNNSIPINPITLKYQENLKGRYQKDSDNKAEVRKLVRGHHLQTMGTSGYNVINGYTVDHTSRLIEKNKDIQQMYEEKLNNFYSNFKLKPQSLEELKASPKKGFKYH